MIGVSLALVGWFASQSDEGAGQTTGAPTAASGSANGGSTSPPPAQPPATITLKTGSGDAIDPTRLLTLNYDDTQKKFSVDITGFADPGKGGTFALTSGAIPLVSFAVAPNDTLAKHLPGNLIVPLESIFDQGSRELLATWRPTGAEAQTSQPLKLKIDTHGPMLDNVNLVGDPAVGLSLVLTFASDDLDTGTAGKADNYQIVALRQDDSPGAKLSLTDDKVSVDHKVVKLDLGRLLTGNYQITINGTAQLTSAAGATVNPLVDTSGNRAGGRGSSGNDQKRRFSSFPSAEQGPQIEFPEYLPTAPQPKPERRANPDDHVETRVVRLYYYRDAARVAQLINRTVKSYNRAAVTQAQQRAEDARTRADQATDQRRHDEREAVRAATELRQAEHELAAAKQQAADAAQQIPQVQSQLSGLVNQQNDLNSAITADQTKVNTIKQQLQAAPASTGQAEELPAPATQPSASAQPAGQPWRNVYRRLTFQQPAPAAPAAPTAPTTTTAPTQADLQAAQADLTSLQSQLSANVQSQSDLNNRLSDLNAAVAQVQALSTKVATLSAQAANANELSLVDADKEERAREDQFRQEVAAAHTDPDTYAPAKLDSIDPVAQVSVSVIGEGLLQLRGPLKGILEIKSMIADEIDAPVGQVKVDIITVQVNGEKGERMEKPVGMIDAHLGLGRFLTAHSLILMRKAVQVEAARIAIEAEQGGHYQVDRDRKYLYSFFGRDFIDELYEMDSEFLHTENMILSLHSMDTISLHRALFILALAKNDVRERIIANFMQLVQSDLVQAEFDYRRSSELKPYKTRHLLPHHDYPDYEVCTFEAVQRNAIERYHFTNFRSFFQNVCCDGDTMNPVQREFIRLAQIFKARLMAETELKQRIIERALVEDDRERSIEQEDALASNLRGQLLDFAQAKQLGQLKVNDAMVDAFSNLENAIAQARADNKRLLAEASAAQQEDASQFVQWLREAVGSRDNPVLLRAATERAAAVISHQRQLYDKMRAINPRTEESETEYHDAMATLAEEQERLTNAIRQPAVAEAQVRVTFAKLYSTFSSYEADLRKNAWGEIERRLDRLEASVSASRINWGDVRDAAQSLRDAVDSLSKDKYPKLYEAYDAALSAVQELKRQYAHYENARSLLASTRSPLDRKKLLDYLIDEKHEKYIDILEGTRSHIATVDNYLKRLAIALEDDFKVQFYEPAFVRIRRAARQWDVTLGQVERTSILTNNRAFAKVTPQATMEFDLPKRDIVLVEALKGAQAVTQDMGALLNDPTFLATFKLMGGGPLPAKVQNVVPPLPSSTDEQRMGHTSDPQRPIGSSLEALIPDPAIYKFETGTGYEIRPVIQPDGDSIVYNFLYMYTTNVREPVRADEKHLGRVKQHFIDTQVQTTSFELREVSRYQVALKAARTGQGVPLLQNIPIAGVLFRPLPSAQSAIQENIILAQSVVYPTLFDLMGLRWAPSIVDLDHVSVRDTGHVARGRNQAITNSIFDITSNRVDEMLDIKNQSPENDRPDLRRRHTQPSPNHPGGYQYPGKVTDPTGEGFQIPDRRPAEMRDPPYDRRFRRPIRFEEVPSVEEYEPVGGDADAPSQEGPSLLRGGTSRRTARTDLEARGMARMRSSVPDADDKFGAIPQHRVPEARRGRVGQAELAVPASPQRDMASGRRVMEPPPSRAGATKPGRVVLRTPDARP